MKNVLAIRGIGLSMAIAGSIACSSATAPKGEEVGQAAATITQVPPDVQCVRITVAGTTTVTRSFDVGTAQSSVLTLTGLPIGTDTFVGDALPVPCGAAGSTRPTWVSQPVVAAVSADAAVNVTLVLLQPANGQGNVAVDFGGGGGSGLPHVAGCDGSGCTCTTGFANCDATLTNGCEVDVSSDSSNCGACGVHCAVGACQNGSCPPTQETLSLDSSNLDGHSFSCGNGFFCGTGDIGFHWQDTAATTVAPTSLQITFAHGIDCAGALTSSVILNGTVVTSYTLPGFDCTCNPFSVPETITLSGAALASYVPGGTNALSIQNPSPGTCEGFNALNGSTYATLVVNF